MDEILHHLFRQHLCHLQRRTTHPFHIGRCCLPGAEFWLLEQVSVEACSTGAPDAFQIPDLPLESLVGPRRLVDTKEHRAEHARANCATRGQSCSAFFVSATCSSRGGLQGLSRSGTRLTEICLDFDLHLLLMTWNSGLRIRA